MGKSSQVPWSYCACTPQQWIDIYVNDDKFYIAYHKARGDIETKCGEWRDVGENRKIREMTFLAPIHAPKRVLQIIGKEHSVITETQYLESSGESSTMTMTSTYRPDTLGNYCDISSIFRVRPNGDGCDACAEVRVTFKMPLVGGLFETFMVRSADASSRQYLDAVATYAATLRLGSPAKAHPGHKRSPSHSSRKSQEGAMPSVSADVLATPTAAPSELAAIIQRTKPTPATRRLFADGDDNSVPPSPTLSHDTTHEHPPGNAQSRSLGSSLPSFERPLPRPRSAPVESLTAMSVEEYKRRLDRIHDILSQHLSVVRSSAEATIDRMNTRIDAVIPVKQHSVSDVPWWVPRRWVRVLLLCSVAWFSWWLVGGRLKGASVSKQADAAIRALKTARSLPMP